MIYTDRQKEIIEKLEGLIGCRFTLDSLSKEVNNIFERDINLTDITVFSDKPTEYNLFFSNNDNIETYGYFNIYYLEMLNKNRNGENIYITDINYFFE